MRGNIPVSVVKALKARGDDLLAFGPQSDGTGIERRLQHIEEPLHLSVMGCAVNGPGEAHDSRIGVTFGRNVGMIYKEGVPLRKVAGVDVVEEFVKEVEALVAAERNEHALD